MIAALALPGIFGVLLLVLWLLRSIGKYPVRFLDEFK